MTTIPRDSRNRAADAGGRVVRVGGSIAAVAGDGCHLSQLQNSDAFRQLLCRYYTA